MHPATHRLGSRASFRPEGAEDSGGGGGRVEREEEERGRGGEKAEKEEEVLESRRVAGAKANDPVTSFLVGLTSTEKLPPRS